MARGPSSADHRPKLCSPQVPAWSLFKRYLLRRLFLVILLKSSRRHSVPRPPLFLRSIYHFWISLFIFPVACFPSSDRGQRLCSALLMTSPPACSRCSANVSGLHPSVHVAQQCERLILQGEGRLRRSARLPDQLPAPGDAACKTTSCSGFVFCFFFFLLVVDFF